jgi:gephyrin
MSNTVEWPLAATIVVKACVADDIIQIQNTIKSWTDGEKNIVDVVLTSGGTGFGIRDFTPEAIKPLLDREAPG